MTSVHFISMVHPKTKFERSGSEFFLSSSEIIFSFDDRLRWLQPTAVRTCSLIGGFVVEIRPRLKKSNGRGSLVVKKTRLADFRWSSCVANLLLRVKASSFN